MKWMVTMLRARSSTISSDDGSRARCKAAVLALGVILVSGCSVETYKADNLYKGDLPQTAVSIIQLEQCKDSDGDDTGRLTLMRVDDHRVVELGKFLLHEAASEIWVLPGKHTVSVAHFRGSARGYSSVWLLTEPGRTYIGRCTSERWSWRFHFEESGVPVGGILGSSDEPPSTPVIPMRDQQPPTELVGGSIDRGDGAPLPASPSPGIATQTVTSTMPTVSAPTIRAPVAGPSEPLAKGQTLQLSADRQLRGQPKAAADRAQRLPAGTFVVLDGQIGDFWFVKSAVASGWLTAEELR